MFIPSGDQQFDANFSPEYFLSCRCAAAKYLPYKKLTDIPRKSVNMLREIIASDQYFLLVALRIILILLPQTGVADFEEYKDFVEPLAGIIIMKFSLSETISNLI